MTKASSPEWVKELTDRTCESWNSDDWVSMAALYADDAEFDPSHVFAGVEAVSGDGIAVCWERIRGSWPGVSMEPLELTAVGSDQVIVPVRLSGSDGVGGEEDQRIALLFELGQDRKVHRCALLSDFSAALAAAEGRGRWS